MTDYWDRQAETRDGAWNAVFSEPDVIAHTEEDVRRISVLLLGPPRLSTPPPGPLLEIGCGVGRLTAMVAKETKRKVVGYDPSLGMIDWAIEGKLSDQVEFTTGTDVFSGTYPWAGVYSMLVFQHLPPDDICSYLSSVHSTLMPGGRFVFQLVVGDHHAPHDHRYSIDEITDFADEAGFDSMMITTDHRHREWLWFVTEKL